MNIAHADNGAKGRFYIERNGITVAEMTYTHAGNERIIIDHTEVSDVLRGQNVGKQLLMQAVDFARNKNLKIIPLCPFAKSLFDKLPEIRDVL